MDRTTALNYLLSAGKRVFQNRNIAAGLHGTSHDAVDRTAVQEELMGVIEGLGLTPDPNSLAQLLQASRRLAGGNVRSITATAALTPDDAGLIPVSCAGGAVTLTLPAANAAGGKPFRYTIIRTDTSAANALTVQRAGADTIEGSSSLTIPIASRLTLHSDGASVWRNVGEAATGRLLSGSGYYRLPGGLILQWGSYNATGGEPPQIGVAFPFTFPGAIFSAGATLSNSTTQSGGLSLYNLSTAGLSIAQTYTGGQTAFLSFSYWAFGA